MGRDNISSEWMTGETKRKTVQGTGKWKGKKYEGNSKLYGSRICIYLGIRRIEMVHGMVEWNGRRNKEW